MAVYKRNEDGSLELIEADRPEAPTPSNEQEAAGLTQDTESSEDD